MANFRMEEATIIALMLVSAVTAGEPSALQQAV
jgi:hypothetical protein